MSQCNYISTCIEPTSVNDAVSCRFLKKNSTNLVLVKHNAIEVYSVRNPQKSTFLNDEASFADRTLTLQKKYYVKEKITVIKAVRPYGDLRDNLLVLTYSTDLILLKYDRRLNDVVTVASAFVGTHMYPFSEVEHLCCITYDHAYAALRVNCELIKIVRLEPPKGSRRLETKSFHVDDSVIINMGFIPDENDCVRLALLTERGQARYISVYELLCGSVQAIRIYGSIDYGLDMSTTQLLTFNTFNSGALVLSSGMISYYRNLGVHTFMSPFLKSQPIVASCVINPYSEVNVIIALDNAGTVYQVTRVTGTDESPFSVQIIGNMPLAQKLVHIEDGLIFGCSSSGSSFLFVIKDSDNNVECEFVDIHVGYGPIIDMIKLRNDQNYIEPYQPSKNQNQNNEENQNNEQNYENNENYSNNQNYYNKNNLNDSSLLLCSGAGLDGTLRILNDGFEITDKYVIDVDKCVDMWVIGPLDATNSSSYNIVMAFSDKTVLFDMSLHFGACVTLPEEVTNSYTLYAVATSNENSANISLSNSFDDNNNPAHMNNSTNLNKSQRKSNKNKSTNIGNTWIQVTRTNIVTIDCSEPYNIKTRWQPAESNEILFSTSTYNKSILAIVTTFGIYVLNIEHKYISILSFIALASVQNVALSFSMSGLPKYIAYNIWGENKVHVFEMTTALVDNKNNLNTPVDNKNNLNTPVTTNHVNQLIASYRDNTSSCTSQIKSRKTATPHPSVSTSTLLTTTDQTTANIVEIACVSVSSNDFINSISLLEANSDKLLLFSSLTNSVLTYCDIHLGTNTNTNNNNISNDETNKKIIYQKFKNKISVPLSLNNKLTIIHTKQLHKLFVVSYGDNTMFVELDYTLLNNSNENNNTYTNENIQVDDFIISKNFLNIPNIRNIFLSPNYGHEIIYLKYNAIVFGVLNYLTHHFIAKSINLFETPIKVCYQAKTNTIALLTAAPFDKKPCHTGVRAYYNDLLVKKGMLHHSEIEHPASIDKCSIVKQHTFDHENDDPDWEWVDIANVYKVVILDRDTLYPIFTLEFNRNEDVITIESLWLGRHSSHPYYVTTSNMTTNSQNAVYRGFVKMFQWKHNKLSLLDTIVIEGLVLSVIAFKSRLIVGVSGELHVYALNRDDKLSLLNKFDCGIIPAFFKVYNHELLVGDIMNNVSIMEMIDHERGVLKLTLQSDMPGWATAAHILVNGMYMNSNIEKYIHIFTKERMCSKSKAINTFVDQIDQDDDAEIATNFVRDANDPNMYRLIDDESRKKILDDNPKRYKIVAKHYTGDHITSICGAPYRFLLQNDTKSSSTSPFNRFINKVTSGVSTTTNSNIINFEEVNNKANTIGYNKVNEVCFNKINEDVDLEGEKASSTSSNLNVDESSSRLHAIYTRLTTYEPSYATMMSSSAGGVKLFFELTPEQFSVLFYVQKKLVNYHQYKRKSNSSIDHNNDLIYTKNLKKFGGGFINGDIVRHVLRLSKPDALKLLSDIPLCTINPLTQQPIRIADVASDGGLDVDSKDHADQKEGDRKEAVVLDADRKEGDDLDVDQVAETSLIHEKQDAGDNAESSSAEETTCYPPEALFQMLVDLNSLI